MTKQVIPPTPPHLAKGHNCPKPRYSALRSGALQPTPPPKPARSKEKGERRTPAPTQGKQTTREIPGSGVRAQPVTTTPTAQGEHSRATTRAHHPAHPHPHLSKGHTCPNPPRATTQRPHRPQHTRSKHRHKKGEGPTIHYGSWGPPHLAYAAPY